MATTNTNKAKKRRGPKRKQVPDGEGRIEYSVKLQVKASTVDRIHALAARERRAVVQQISLLLEEHPALSTLSNLLSGGQPQGQTGT